MPGCAGLPEGGDPGGKLRARPQEAGTGEGEKWICRLRPGSQEGLARGKDEETSGGRRREREARERERRTGGGAAAGRGGAGRGGGGWRRAVTERKGKERWRNKRGEARGAERRKIGEESRRGMGDDLNENERVGGQTGGAPTSASPRRAPARARSPGARTHFVTITGPSLGLDCFSQIVVL